MSAPNKIAVPVRLSTLAAAFLWLAAPAAAGARDYGSEYASALLGEALRGELREASRKVPRSQETRKLAGETGGPRSWNPAEMSPWANAYGTPSAGLAPRVSLGVLGITDGWRPARLCACYLPADARSWDGGPLTEADVARMCRAQCN